MLGAPICMVHCPHPTSITCLPACRPADGQASGSQAKRPLEVQSRELLQGSGTTFTSLRYVRNKRLCGSLPFMPVLIAVGV